MVSHSTQYLLIYAGVELVGKRKREITGIVLNYFYAIGEALVALIAWYTKDWVLLQLIVSAPAILFFVYYW
jgi:OCT family organic cation transporter-like MFS transporter 4/5